MFSSRRAKLSNADSAPGESLFDFLRRKKRVSLEDSIRQSRKESHEMSFSNIEAKQQEESQPVETTRQQTYRKNASSNVTPKRVTFVESQQKRNTARTFIDMISPIKPKQSQVYQKQLLSLEQQKQTSKSISNRKKAESQEFSRKEFNKSLQVMMETIKKLIHVGKSIKQKSHSLFVDMKPVFKIAQESTNKIIKRKVQEAKEKLRVMEHQFQELDIQNENQIIDSFHRNLSEHLVSMESKNRSSFEKSEMEGLARIKGEKDAKISDLTNENRNLLQNANILQRKIEKLQAALSNNQDKQQQKFQNYQQNNEQKFSRLESSYKQLEEQNSELQEKLQQLKKQSSEKDKRLKDALYAKQSTEKRLLQQNQKTKSAREQFLLNEIMLLKQEFQGDMTQLTTLYTVKQRDHLAIIEEQRKQIKELKDFIQGNKENQKKIGSDAETLKAVVNKYRKQNQCLVTDMHRMNEELYQHWLALKDIKTLATRLQLMPRFARIYEDLAFNDLLFS